MGSPDYEWPMATTLPRQPKYRRMIDKNLITTWVNQWLEGKDYFLTDVNVSTDNRIVVEIDHEEGVWIEDCVELSRFIESNLNRDEEDFELEVGSAGIGQPFKVLKQYEIHVGKDVEVQLKDGHKMQGVLTAVSPDSFEVTVEKKVKEEGMKRPKMVATPITLTYDEVVSTKYVIKMK